MTQKTIQRFCIYIGVLCMLLGITYVWFVFDAQALNIFSFNDTLSNSAPDQYSNHTLNFRIGTDIDPGGYIDFSPPPGFTVVATSTFSARNVELYVNGVPRSASSTGNATTDEVSITPGSPGLIRYTLNSTTGIAEDDVLQLRIGDNTSNSFNGEQIFSTSTGSTTLPNDVGILNANATGTHKFTLEVDGGATAYATFWIATIDKVGVGPIDTRETDPPLRFNGAPTGNVGGTTLSVELSLETNEFAICRFSSTSSVPFQSMPNTFTNTGLIVHSQVIGGLVNGETYSYYVRCIDDEDNFNIDDYVISFTVLDVPEGEPNSEGDVEGDGTGTGNEGTGDEGGGSGGGTGDGDSDNNASGNSSGGGGGGGSGSGGTGNTGDDDGEGGFEPEEGEYPSGDARIVISGYAFPRSEIVILVDGVIVERGTANTTGSFSVTLDEIARGVYTFGVYAVDDNDVKSTTFSTSFSVQGGRTSTLSNVNIMPSILVDPDPVDPNSTVQFRGFSIPNANITVQSQRDGSSVSLKTLTTTSNANGAWSVDLSTSGFSPGTYKVRAKAEQTGGVSTNYSDYTFYGVGQEAAGQITADLNRDGNVNLIDFSILLFWWGTDGGATNPPADINGDGNVSLTDFSIMLFNWTG